MNLSIGIVGLPNVGKSTLFSALTKQQVAAENFPFCTIDPNVGVVAVPDERLSQLTAISHSAKTVPAIVEFVDIAGLVKGASQGEGLGNKFLSTIRETAAIALVVRLFEDPNVIHVSGTIDPLSDVETIRTELALSDLATVEKRKQSIDKEARSGDKEKIALSAVLTKAYEALNAGTWVNEVSFSEEEIPHLKELHLLTAKPLLYILNISEDQAKDRERLEQELTVKLPGARPGSVIAISAKIEAELAQLTEDECRTFLDDLGWEEAGLARLIRASFKTLGLMTFFTSGEMESKAWTIRVGTKAPQAAGEIHGDFEKAFIRAEVISAADFIAFGGESPARDAGKLRIEGKDYVMQDGDVVHFRVAV